VRHSRSSDSIVKPTAFKSRFHASLRGNGEHLAGRTMRNYRNHRLEEEHESHERWLISYADFITLLFAFFVTMYALSSVNEGKYRVLSDSLVQAFRNVPVNSSGTQIVVKTELLPVRPAMATHKDPRIEAQRRITRGRMRDMAHELSGAMAPLVREGRVSVTETARGVTVEINASVLFTPGDAKLDLSAIKALSAVAEILARTDYPVTVEGHTDTTPISTAQFPSNWELSVVRASSVVRLFVAAGVPPQMLTATGYGEQRPVASNDSEDGRARNRRVAILIESPSAELAEEIPLVLPVNGEPTVSYPTQKRAG
jgi:chemotaxis protein MotB